MWPPSVLSIQASRSPAHWVCLQFPFRAPVSVLAPTVWSRRRHCAIWPAGGGEVGPWPAGLPGALVGVGVGDSLRRTISLSAFDLGQGLPASKWSQLLLQAEANGQERAGGGDLEGRGV